MSPPPKLSRRAMTVGGIAAVGVAAIAGAVYELPRLFRPRSRGAYADLANLLDDTDQAAIVGRKLMDQLGVGTAIEPGSIVDRAVRESASEIRTRLKRAPLRDLCAADAVKGTLIEVDGWVIPATLGALCIMAADGR
jgi:hypothetical protein